jgi:hypothetical protein
MCIKSAHLMGERILGTEHERGGNVKVHTYTRRDATDRDSGVIWLISISRFKGCADLNNLLKLPQGTKHGA